MKQGKTIDEQLSQLKYRTIRKRIEPFKMSIIIQLQATYFPSKIKLQDTISLAHP